MLFRLKLNLLVCMLLGAVFVEAQQIEAPLVTDQDVKISEAEFQRALETMPPALRENIANDVGDRIEVINQMVVSRRLAAEADAITLSSDPEAYLDLHMAVIAAKQKFVFDKLTAEIQVPNLEPLAREWYRTQKEKYAAVPEVRGSSHILFRSRPGLDRTEVRAKANAVLAQLRDGANFEDLVEEYSQDPGTKRRGGSLGKLVRFGDPGITPPYTEALFEIEKVGEYSEVTDSQFGVHIIRLDEVRPRTYAPFDVAKEPIIADIRREFQTLATKELRARFGITDQLYINGPALDELLAPYESNTPD